MNENENLNDNNYNNNNNNNKSNIFLQNYFNFRSVNPYPLTIVE